MRVNDRLLVVGGVDKVPAVVKVGVEELEAGRLVHLAHTEGTPFIVDAHGAELQRRDMYAGEG